MTTQKWPPYTKCGVSAGTPRTLRTRFISFIEEAGELRKYCIFYDNNHKLIDDCHKHFFQRNRHTQEGESDMWREKSTKRSERRKKAINIAAYELCEMEWCTLNANWAQIKKSPNNKNNNNNNRRKNTLIACILANGFGWSVGWLM